jgi:D-alanine-D-alanine ligase
MAKKLRVGILFGGRSGEHEVSLLSAASVLKAIDREEVRRPRSALPRTAAGWRPRMRNHLLTGDISAVARRLRAGDPEATPGAKLLHEGIPTLLAPEPRAGAPKVGGKQGPAAANLDVVFPVLHGTFGEDGTIQGLFELAGIAYVGSGVLGSAAGMDKDVMKRLFAKAGLPIVKHVTLLRADWEKQPRKAIAPGGGGASYPVFVKPANLGSSVGISKAHDRKELAPALTLAAKYDRKLVVEQGVGGKKAAGGART